jgi:hypothetical protein
MDYTPLTYPPEITKATWDRKKGLVAKALGETGIGEACANAEALFDKIDWAAFDIIKLTPTSSSDEALAKVKALKPGVLAEHNKTVKPTIAALKEINKKAEEAAAKLRKNILTKGTAKTAEDIATTADHFSVALQLHSQFFDKVAKEADKSLEDIEKSRARIAENMSQTKDFLADLLHGLQKFSSIDPPTMKDWDDHVKQQGRSVSNNLKGNPELAKKYLKTWVTKFQGFDWVTIGFDKLDPEALKHETKAFMAQVVQEARVLSQDLH